MLTGLHESIVTAGRSGIPNVSVSEARKLVVIIEVPDGSRQSISRRLRIIDRLCIQVAEPSVTPILNQPEQRPR